MGTKIVYSGSEGGGLSSLPIKDEGVAIGDATSLNFVGNGVTAVNAGSGEIVIQIPPSTYAPYFNQTGALVADVTTVSRIVAEPTSEGTPYKIGDWVANIAKPCTNSSSLVYQTSSFFSIFDDANTTIKVEVLDADGVSVLATNTQTITGNLDNTSDNIRIEITDFTTDTDKFKGKFKATIALSSVLSEGGRFSIKITHTNTGEGTYVKLQSNVFYDTNPINPTISNPTFSENVPVVVYTSGVRSYGAGSTFNVALNSIDNINNRSYPSTFINVVGTELALPALNLTAAQLASWTGKYNNTGASYTNAGWSVTTPNYYNKGALKAQARWIDWVTNTYQNSLTLNAVVSTWQNNATGVYEDFRNETRRYNSAYSAVWDSTAPLGTHDSGNGLQALNSQLIYPQEDFTSYNPDNSNQPDYSALTGTRVWCSEFNHSGVSHSNGIFRFGLHNITEQMILDKDVEIKISLDNVSWYTLSEDYVGGALSNGSGCRVEPDTYNMGNNQLKFTLGVGKFTDGSTGLGYGLFYKIIYKDNANGKAAYIGSFEVTNWV